MSLPRLEYPTYETNLISTDKKVTYRPFVVKEHKILMTLKNASGAEIARIITQLVDSCTFNALDINNIPYFDIEYLFLQIRAKSIGEVVDVKVKCKNCDNKINTSYNIDDLKVIKKDNHTNKIELSPTTGIIMKYPNIEYAIKLFDSEDTNNVISDLIVSSIEAIYDKDNYWTSDILDKTEINEFIDNLQKPDFDKIENFFVSSPKIVQEIEGKCDKCESDIKVKLEGLYNFFV